MKLRNEALNKGTSALIATQTHVENGSKIAKGEDALGGVVSQFSSLMSVMQDDFALMNDMEREYEGERSEVEPVLPEELAVVLPNEVKREERETTQEKAVPNSDFDREIATERLFEDLLIESAMPTVVPTVDNTMVEQTIAGTTETLELSAVSDVVDVVESAPVPMFAPQPVVDTALVAAENMMPVKEVVVATPQQVPEMLAQEILESFQPMLVETVEEVDDAPRFTMSERVDLPDYLREEVRLLDDDVLPLEDSVIELEELEITPQRKGFEQAVTTRVESQVQNNQPILSDVQASLQAISTSQQVQGQVQVVQPTVTSQVDGVAVQQTKSVETTKDVKLPKLHLTRQSFEELLEESQEKGTEQMGFRSKLIQKLEMVIQDPMGRLDVEVAQEVTGVNVKAAVPAEVLPSLMGLEGDLQIALDNKGIDLSHFELFERKEGSQNDGQTVTSSDIEDSQSPENDEKLLSGGMLINRRV